MIILQQLLLQQDTLRSHMPYQLLHIQITNHNAKK